MAVIRSVPSYYTPEQLAAYLVALGLPTAEAQPSLEHLTNLVRRHIQTFPFENTQMHYTKTGEMKHDPESVFTRLVVEKKGGTLCYGQHNLMIGMLRELGYR